MAAFYLTALDYIIIVLMFSVSASIGIFFAYCGKQTSEEYFLGGRRMNVVPVIISMTVTVMSAITYLGLPGEVYLLGPKFALMFVSKFLVAFLTTQFFLPVFYRLRLVSVYEYYDNRFSVALRYCIMASEYCHSLIYNGVVIFVPSLALSTITGISLVFSIVSVGVICTFYTTIGGFKAVIWADVFQASVMLVGSLMIIIAGTVRIGGAAEGWRRAKEGHRGQLVDFNFDPTVRYTFWTIMIGGTCFYTMINGSKQALIQRYNSCKTEREAKLVAWVGIIGMGAVEMLAVVCGMVGFAWYAYCDPLTEGRITSHDQLLPLLVMDLFHGIPGLPGIAIAGAFCASLSSISSLINALAAVTGETIIKNFWRDISDEKYTRLVKVISACFGLISIGIALLTSFLGGVIQIVLSLGGIFGGPGLGVVCLGIFIPRADSRSAMSGLIVAVLVGLTLEVGSRVTGSRAQPLLPVSVEGCESLNSSYVTGSSDYEVYTEPATDVYIQPTGYGNVTGAQSDVEAHAKRIAVFAISNLHYSTISTFVTVVVGVLVSYFPGGKGPDACDPAHLTPMVQKYFLRSRGIKERGNNNDGKQYQEVRATEMENVTKAI